VALIGALTICAALISHTVADQAKLTVTYDIYRFVTQGEPVLLTYTLRNVSSDVISVQVGSPPDRGFLRIVVTGPGNRIQVMSPEDYPLRVPRLPFTGRSGRRGMQGILLLSRWVNFDEVGDYRIKIVFEGEALDGPPDQPGTPLDFERSATLAVKVVPHNSKALLRRGQEWLALATGPEPDITRQRRAAEALSLIQDPIVIPLLEQLIRSGKGFEVYPFQALVRFGGPEALRIVTSFTTHPNVEIAWLAKKALGELQNRGIR
jgi:hypothetical protein